MFDAARHDVGDSTQMRQDWTLLCAGVTALPSGGIEMRNVVTVAEVADELRRSPIDTVLRIDSPLWLVSQWTAEFNVDRRVHSGLLQLVAPGGGRVLNQQALQLDFRHTIVYRFIRRIREFRYIGLGTYEFHILVADFAERGEWGRACIRVS